MKLNFLKTTIGYFLIIIVTIWIILAIFFGVFDLQISSSFVDENSLWGEFGAEYGEPPGYGLISIGLAVLIGGYIKDLKKQKIPGYLSIIAGSIYLLIGIMDNSNTDIFTGVCLIIPIAVFMLFTWNKDWKRYRNISTIISILAILNPLIFVQLSKLFFGRVRFRDLALDYSNFTPWYLPQGITGNYSFPSGHAAMGFMFLPILIMVKDLKWKDYKKIITVILVLGWGFFVGFSRIVVGAHYASDVLFSTGFASIITILLYKKYYLN
ncbi:MAG: phosphatase PAP2 family protein [Candidatus Thorarchaeota archaeon]